jgi:hypothetical protein
VEGGAGERGSGGVPQCKRKLVLLLRQEIMVEYRHGCATTTKMKAHWPLAILG